jgi:hypothetical protein
MRLRHQANSTPDTAATHENKPKIRKIIKRIYKRKSSRHSHSSPFCRSTKRQFKKIEMYVNEHGQEVDQFGNLIKKTETEEEKAEKAEDEVEEEEQEEGTAEEQPSLMETRSSPRNKPSPRQPEKEEKPKEINIETALAEPG